MLGAIIGDIIGSRWEFSPTNDYHFELLSPLNSYTDDTICTVAVADALLHGSKDFGRYIHDWCRRYNNPMGGYGCSFARWVASDNPEPYGSYGNGAAMRVSPVAHWYKTKRAVLDAAAATAMPTHNHPEGIRGAQTVALAIYKAMEYNRFIYQNAARHIDDIINTCVKFSGYDINMPRSAVQNRFDETCQGTVPVALKIISMATCFEDAVRMAVSLGADADTLGAITGSIAEAIWGIPMKLRNDIKKYLPKEMLAVIAEFYRNRPCSYKPLIDTTFSGDDFSNVSWDMLYDIDGEKEYSKAINETMSRNSEDRKMMSERGKAREKW